MVCRLVVAYLVPLFCFMFIQGEELIDASRNGNMATVERLLKDNPHLVNYKDSVRRSEYMQHRMTSSG